MRDGGLRWCQIGLGWTRAVEITRQKRGRFSLVLVERLDNRIRFWLEAKHVRRKPPCSST